MMRLPKFSKKGQGLSLNVIIVAALALIVLVVLIMVFTGRIQIFDKALGDKGDAELVKQKIYYGKCHPGQSFETTFVSEVSSAQDNNAKDTAIAKFRGEINRCKSFSSDKTACEAETGCFWN